MSALTPFPLPPQPTDPTVAPAHPLRFLYGNPTPEEVVAVTAALLASLRREPPAAPGTPRPGRARWSRSEGSATTGSWRSVPRGH
ncbi:acyl-CoA carboxylase subunit epsilon [Streptomyces sp. NPDC048301]|uniref:acyl-CoA carboxylase subunit epsilon n=1 Tax=unclassified Streptomyces TaxID=2593676 RepID=UPI00342691DA